MELICKKEFVNKIGAKFILNKRYKFEFESGFEYYTTDDNGEVCCMSEDIIFEHFTFEFQ